GCASTGRPEDARSEILRLDAEWSRVAAEGRDVDRAVSFWSDDAVVMAPASAPIVGRAAIREFVAQSFRTSGFHISWKTATVVVARGGDMAYSTGTNRVEVNGADGRPIVIPGKSVAVWRREKGGAWKCVVDIWNDSPGPETRAAASVQFPGRMD
ncbi:MAG: DUF4440 domain-containing protein, partial [Acidobacteriota bacterium]